MTKDDIVGKIITITHQTLQINEPLEKFVGIPTPLKDAPRYADASAAALQHLMQDLVEEDANNLTVLMEVLNEHNESTGRPVYPEVRLMQQWQNMLMTKEPMDAYYDADLYFSKQRAGLELTPEEKGLLQALAPLDIVHPWPAGFKGVDVTDISGSLEHPTEEVALPSTPTVTVTVTDTIINAALMKDAPGVQAPSLKQFMDVPQEGLAAGNPHSPMDDNNAVLDQIKKNLGQGGFDIPASLEHLTSRSASDILSILDTQLGKDNKLNELYMFDDIIRRSKDNPLQYQKVDFDTGLKHVAAAFNVDIETPLIPVQAAADKEAINTTPDVSGSFDTSVPLATMHVHDANEDKPASTPAAGTVSVPVDTPTVLRTPVASYQEKRGIIEDVALMNGVPIVSGKEWRGTRMPRTAPLMVADFDFATIDRDGVGRAAYLLVGPSSADDVRIELKSQSTSGSAGDKLPTSVLRLVNAGATQSYGRAIVGVVGLQFFAPEALSLAREVAGKSARVRLVEGQENFVEVLQQHVTDVKARHAAVAPKVEPVDTTPGPNDLGYDGV